MKRKLLFAFFIFSTFCLFAKTLKVGFYESNAFTQRGKTDKTNFGYAVEYVNKFADIANVKINYVYSDWGTLLKMLQNGEIDIMPGVTFTEDRSAYIHFPKYPMGVGSYYLFSRTDNEAVSKTDTSTINDKKIGIVTNTVLYDYVIKWLRNKKIHANIKLYNSMPERDEALLNGEVDIICASDYETTGLNYLNQLFLVGFSENFLVCSIDNREVRELLDSAIDELFEKDPFFVRNLRTKYYESDLVELALEDYKKSDSLKLKEMVLNHPRVILYLILCALTFIFLFVFFYSHLAIKSKNIEIKGSKVIREEMELLQTMSKIYLSVHQVNLKNNTLRTIKALNGIVKYQISNDAQLSFNNAMKDRCTPPFLEHVLNFVNIKSLPMRMMGKTMISTEFVGNYSGWCRISFITIHTDENGAPIDVLFTVQIIEEEKKNEELLKKLAQTDSLSGLSNRNSYELMLKDYDDKKLDPSLVAISMDLNGLKMVNDTYGHDAGDEIIVGASKIIQDSFGLLGKTFRVGGDEFVIIISAESYEIKLILDEFEKRVEQWHGKLINKLHISYGYAVASDYLDLTLPELIKKSDQKMYEMKRQYYANKFSDRRNR